MGLDQIYDSVIVGAGISGLVAGYELTAAGASVLILEANNYAGGRVHTIRYGSYYAEAGGMIVTDEDTSALQLLRDLTIELSPPWGRHGTEIFLNDRIVRLDGDQHLPEGFIKLASSAESKNVPLFSETGLIRAYGDAMREIDRQSKSIEFPYKPDFIDDWDTTTFGEFLDSFHPELRNYFDLHLKATAGASVDQMSLFWGIICTQWNLENRFYAIEGGTDRLPLELFKRMRKQVKLNAPVQSVSSLNCKTTRVSYFDNGTRKETMSKTVIMATTPRAVLEIVADLEQKKVEALRKVCFGSYIPVHLRFRDRFWKNHIKTGYLNCADMVFADIVDATRDQHVDGGVLICFIAGSDSALLIHANDEQIIKSVLQDFDRVFPGKAGEVLEAKVFRWPEAIPYLPPHYTPILEDLQRHQGNIYFCGDYTQGAGLNEAIYSGQIASRKVIRDLA